jgi:hypothetical protein
MRRPAYLTANHVVMIATLIARGCTLHKDVRDVRRDPYFGLVNGKVDTANRLPSGSRK